MYGNKLNHLLCRETTCSGAKASTGVGRMFKLENMPRGEKGDAECPCHLDSPSEPHGGTEKDWIRDLTAVRWKKMEDTPRSAQRAYLALPG